MLDPVSVRQLACLKAIDEIDDDDYDDGDYDVDDDDDSDYEDDYDDVDYDDDSDGGQVLLILFQCTDVPFHHNHIHSTS